ncbi:MAG: hypothetical protein ACRC7S_18680 [Cetobacterium sp.]
MATFSSLEAIMKHIEKATTDSMKEVGEELEDVFKDAIDEEVYDAYDPVEYDRTYQLRDEMVEITNLGKDNVEVSITHTGDHISYIKGTRFYVPFGLEGGYTWGDRGVNRPATDIEGNAIIKAEDRVPDVYKKSMRSKGIPIK